MTHICVGNLTIIGPDNGLSPGRRQAIICTNAGILLIGPLGTNFSEIQIGIQTVSYKKMHLKMSSVKWRPFFLGLYVLTPSISPMQSFVVIKIQANMAISVPIISNCSLSWTLFFYMNYVSLCDKMYAISYQKDNCIKNVKATFETSFSLDKSATSYLSFILQTLHFIKHGKE